ncbi:hypothetical protein [Anaerocellum danielii]|uniref:Uncharacterized protein n=1 Tax=Anaerocellum danielii TaxID=1387557 RepID=A0ABZ0TXA1_9FIRM|nr:hypothetical protein [Caldicellulosiruptor danielii]WPX08076.1 hypothetical protein SOJ16_001930 [Caldicellulosiruptor danielii]
MRGVIGPLKSAAPDCNLKIVIDICASTQEGFNRRAIDITIRETLRQIGAEVMEWIEK